MIPDFVELDMVEIVLGPEITEFKRLLDVEVDNPLISSMAGLWP